MVFNATFNNISVLSWQNNMSLWIYSPTWLDRTILAPTSFVRNKQVFGFLCVKLTKIPFIYYTNSSWHWGPNDSLLTGLSPLSHYMDRNEAEVHSWGPHNIFEVTDLSINYHLAKNYDINAYERNFLRNLGQCPHSGTSIHRFLPSVL